MNKSGLGVRIASTLALIAPLFAIAAELPPLPQGLSAPSTPTKMPAFSLPTVAGGTVRADEFKGKVIIARFWATW